MEVVIFGCGPMPNEPHYAVTAPGSRTWQILKTVARGIAPAHALEAPPRIIVIGLESAARQDASMSVPLSLGSPNGGTVEVEYIPLEPTAFRVAAETGKAGAVELPAQPHAVVSCASIQPCAMGAVYAARCGSPLWVDVFGDPLAEIQTQVALHPEDEDSNGHRSVDVWRLLITALLRGDAFSTLSHPQRFALLGQLGAAGRLNQFTVDPNLVTAIPFAIFPEDLPAMPAGRPINPAATFNLLWCGSFNTWMDVDSLVDGFVHASRQNPRIRLIVVGGRIAGYNTESYDRFVNAIRTAGAEGVVQLLDWQPLGAMPQLYAACDIGLCIDQRTYEAELGSRTRIINFLAAGKPVLSTVATELTHDLAREGFVIPYQVENPEDLGRVILECAAKKEQLQELGLAGRGYISTVYNAAECGSRLAEWIRQPTRAGDAATENRNGLQQYWGRTLEFLKKSSAKQG